MGLQAAILGRDSTVGGKSTEEGVLSVGKSQALLGTSPSALLWSGVNGKPAEQRVPAQHGASLSSWRAEGTGNATSTAWGHRAVPDGLSCCPGPAAPAQGLSHCMWQVPAGPLHA